MSDRPLTLFIIDEDAVFRLGLVTALLNYPQFQVLAQMARLTEGPIDWPATPPDLVILDPLLLTGTSTGWEQCWLLRRTYPSVKVCLLTASLEYRQLLQARNLGIEGYFPKGTPIAELAAGFSAILQGTPCWASPRSLPTYQSLSPAQQWLWRGFQGGLEQIKTQRLALQQASQQPRLSAFDALFLQGRQRELHLAQRMVEHLMPPGLKRLYQVQTVQKEEAQGATLPVPSGAYSPPALRALTSNPEQAGPPLPSFNGQNLTAIPLALDALNVDQRALLFALTWQHLQDSLGQLRRLNMTPDQFPQDPSPILAEVWQRVTFRFLGPHLDPQSSWTLDQLQALLESYKPIIQRESLATIPLARAVLARCLLATLPEST